MNTKSALPFSGSQIKTLWQGAKVDMEYAPTFVQQALQFTQNVIDDGVCDHPNRVYVEKPSERFLATMTPLLGLKHMGSGRLVERWQVAVSEQTDKLDPIAARNINNFLASNLQNMFWKKDAQFIVDSAPLEPESNLIAIDFGGPRRQ